MEDIITYYVDIINHSAQLIDTELTYRKKYMKNKCFLLYDGTECIGNIIKSFVNKDLPNFTINKNDLSFIEKEIADRCYLKQKYKNVCIVIKYNKDIDIYANIGY